MKKIILSLVAIFGFGAAAQAQDGGDFGFNQGNLFLEGNVRFSSQWTAGANSDSKSNLFEVSPAAGYFLSDKFAVGLGLSYKAYKNIKREWDTTSEKYGKVVPNASQKVSSFGFDLFGRYYLLELGQRFKVYGQADLGFDFESNQPVGGGSKDKYTTFNIGAGLGMNYFVTPKLAINFGLSDIISFNSRKPKGSDATNTFKGDFNVFNNFFTTPTFGLTYKLN